MRTLLVTPMLILAGLAGTSSAAAAPITHPTGAAAVVIRVSSDGGFVAPGAILGRVPSFTLFGDGTVIVPGVTTQIFPGPAVAPLLRTRLSEARVQAILRRAKAAGLLAARPVDYGDMRTIRVADATTTVVRLHAGGRSVVRRAYALGITAAGGAMPPAQAAARRALEQFVRSLPNAPGGAPYVTQALAVYVSPYGGQAAPGKDTKRWPLAARLASTGTSRPAFRCISVRGGPARTLLTVLGRADEQTRWLAPGGGARGFSLIIRPLLPDERDCSSLAR